MPHASAAACFLGSWTHLVQRVRAAVDLSSVTAFSVGSWEQIEALVRTCGEADGVELLCMLDDAETAREITAGLTESLRDDPRFQAADQVGGEDAGVYLAVWTDRPRA